MKKIKEMVGTIKKVSYNLKSQIDEFVKLFLDIDGIKEIMELIVESQRIEHNDLIQTLCNMLATCLLYKIFRKILSALSH